MYQQRYKKVYKIKKTCFSLKTLSFIWTVLKQRIAYAICEHNTKFPDLIFHVSGCHPKKIQDTNLVDAHFQKIIFDIC